MKTSETLSCGLVVVALAALTLASGCTGRDDAAPKKGAPPGVSPIVTATFGTGSANEGERLFGQECGFCHVGKSTGTMMLGRRLGKEQGELARRTDLDGDYVKSVVRNGMMNMPPLSRVEVTDEELDKIAAWLVRKDR